MAILTNRRDVRHGILNGLTGAEDEQLLTFRCGGDSQLVVTRSTTGTADDATKASWRVGTSLTKSPDSGRAAEIEDLPELKTVDGIADLGLALAAWFTDLHQNSIGLLQFK